VIRIILAEDHNIVRNGIRNLLEKEADLEVVGEALNGQEVLSLLENGTAADIVLADINMPVMSGIEMMAKLQPVAGSPKVLVLTMLDSERYIIQAFQAGISGYLLKNISADELVFAIRHVYTDSRYICSELSLRFLDKLIEQPGYHLQEAQNSAELSARELEILALIAEGFTNQEIADKLFTSKRTVEGNRQALLEKTGARNTAALIRYAIHNKLVS
jgi:DNA-binding NarL/FixJ family response regulator